MKLCLVVAVVLAIGVNFSPRTKGQQSSTAEQQKTAKQSSTTLLAAPQVNRPEQQTNTTTNKPPSGDSPAQWVLIFSALITAAVVGWQAWLTRSYVELSRHGHIAQFRPRLHIRGMHLNDSDDLLQIEITLVNRGDGVGTIVSATAKLSILFNYGGPSELQETSFNKFSLLPGEDAPLIIPFRENRFLHILSVETDNGVPLRCQGVIKYADADGTERNTGFRRNYTQISQKFIADDDSEYEYED